MYYPKFILSNQEEESISVYKGLKYWSIPQSFSLGGKCGIEFINSFLASGNFCWLLITFANSLDPDQDGHN